MRAYSDAELAEFLGAPGIPLDAYSLIGEPGADLAALYLPEIGFRCMISSNPKLACASKAFLARRGARRFRDTTEWQAAAHAERWPGWERHAPGAPGAESGRTPAAPDRAGG